MQFLAQQVYQTFIRKLKTGWRILKEEGFSAFLEISSQKILSLGILSGFHVQSAYDRWVIYNEPNDQELKKQKLNSESFPYQPLISILVPVFNVAEKFLIELLDSVLTQTYPNWELCIANASVEKRKLNQILSEYQKKDDRIRLVELKGNFGISNNTNALLEVARGDYVALLDHDDRLAPFALYEIVKMLCNNPALDMIYSDHDILEGDSGKRINPLFKPDWSPEIMLSSNYITHLTVIRRELIRRVGGFREEFDGAQDWDLFLRIIEITDRIGHIPKILYHWRESSNSTAGSIYNKPYALEAQLKAVREYLIRTGKKNPDAFFDKSGYIRVKWDYDQPKVSILIPTRGANLLLQKCVESIISKTVYENYEIVMINNGEHPPEYYEYFRGIKDRRMRVLHYEGKFNYSAVNNYGVSYTDSELLLFLNNDTEVIDETWLDELVMWASTPEIGAVGAKLLRPGGGIQHAGIIVGLTGFAGHVFADCSEGAWTIFGSTEWYRDYLAVTAACMMVRRSTFEEVGRFKEEFTLCGNDVEFGIRLNKHGYRVVYNPFVRLYHHEAATRENAIPEKDFIVSFEEYLEFLQVGDPFYNPNLSYWSLGPTLRKVKEIPPDRFASDYIRVIKG